MNIDVKEAYLKIIREGSLNEMVDNDILYDVLLAFDIEDWEKELNLESITENKDK